MITYDDFKKVEMRAGKIISAEPIEGSEKLLKLMVDFGSASADPRYAEGSDEWRAWQEARDSLVAELERRAHAR